jgi:dipeptidyl aminopeptidase/acylaminoacyl peptidase
MRIRLPGGQLIPSWTPDGRILASQQDSTTRGDLIIIDPESGAFTTLRKTLANEQMPIASPDGRWVAYVSDESEVDEVYVMPLSGGDAHQVSDGGGTDPVWSRDGPELFYRSGRRIMAVQWPPLEGAAAGRPVQLFEAPYDFTQTRNWDAVRGGGFIMVKADPSTNSRFKVVLNWFSELERAVGREARR